MLVEGHPDSGAIFARKVSEPSVKDLIDYWMLGLPRNLSEGPGQRYDPSRPPPAANRTETPTPAVDWSTFPVRRGLALRSPAEVQRLHLAAVTRRLQQALKTTGIGPPTGCDWDISQPLRGKG